MGITQQQSPASVCNLGFNMQQCQKWLSVNQILGEEVRILKGELELIFGEKKFLHISLLTIFPKLVEIWHHLIQHTLVKEH